MATAKTRDDLKKFLTWDSAQTYRRPSDLISAILGTIILLLAVLILLTTKRLLPLGDLLFAVGHFLPNSALLPPLLQAGALGAVFLAVLLAFTTRQLLLARNLAIGGLFAWLVTTLVKVILERGSQADLLDEIFLRVPSNPGVGIPSASVAVVTSLATIAEPYLRGRWRWLVWSAAALVVLLAFAGGAYSAIEVIAALALGVVIGALMNLLLGVPQRDVSTRVIKQAFKEHAITVRDIKPVSADARGSVPYFATAADGTPYFVKMVGAQQRNADLLFKMWRTLLMKDVASSAPFLTPMQQIEHEAYLTLLAQKHQVRTPDVEFTARVAGDYALLIQKRVMGRALLDLADDEITDSLLIETWKQVLYLHEARIYHGDLRLANILLDEEQRPWVIDFGFAAADADDEVLAQDTAQMLASMAPIVGAERTVRTALRILGPQDLQRSAPALQPLALSSATREDLKRNPDFLKELQEAITEQAGESRTQEDKTVFRIRRKNVLFAVGLGVGVYVLFPQLGEFSKIINAWESANPLLIGLGLFGALMSYAFGAVSTQGAVQKTLSFIHLVVAQFAATFGSRFSPQSVGGYYVLEKFIEKSGVQPETSVAAISLNAAAGVVTHLILSLTVLTAVGIGGAALFKNIAAWQIVLAVIVLLVLVALARIMFPDRMKELMEKARTSLRNLYAVLREPLRALELFGGATALTLSNIFTLLVSLWAVQVNIPVLNVAAVYLAGSIIGTASPTPGGLGVLEGAFLAALGLFGVPTNQAVAGVLLYRFLTFWLPILPGFIAFRFLQHEKYL